jgi:sugar (pentulose or hexulose) kinase
MFSAPVDLDALSLEDLKELMVQLLTRVATLEEESQRLRAENARLKGLPKRPKLAPGSLDQASQSGPSPQKLFVDVRLRLPR